MSYHALEDQAQLVSQGSLDLAAYVMRDDAEFLHSVIRKYGLDIADLQDLQGLVGRHSWLSLGRVPAGRVHDLVHRIPPHEKIVPQVNTLVVASPCARRSSRIELLVLLSAELPRFVRSKPTKFNELSLSNRGSAFVGSQAVFSHGRARICRPIFPMAGQHNVARILDLFRHGSDTLLTP